MSLRGRLLVLMVLMNLLVLGIISVMTLVIQDRWMDRVTKAHLDQLFLPASAHTAGVNSLKAIENVREILSLRFRDRFQDILIRKNNRANDYIDLNPLGSASRDHATFPYEAVREGIQRAIDEEALVRVAGGTSNAIPRACDCGDQHGLEQGGVIKIMGRLQEIHDFRKSTS